MVHDDSQSTLRASADSISRRAGSVGMAGLPAPWLPHDINGPAVAKNLKLSRHTAIN
jgi:hypothetical protein